MSILRFGWGLLVLVLAGQLGCGGPGTDAQPPGPTARAGAPTEPSEGAEPSEIEGPESAPAGRSIPVDQVPLAKADAEAFAQVLRRHEGKVILVDFWATWCTECVELFPHTVELSRQLADKGLVVLSYSFDYPEDEPAVRRLLAQQGATFENYLSPYEQPVEGTQAFGIPDDLLPCFRLYDRQGRLHKTFTPVDDEPFGPEWIDRAIAQLLDGAPGEGGQ